MFYCFVFFAIILLIYILVNLLRVFRNIVNSFYILSSHSISVNVDKDITHRVRLESNITSLELWIIFPVTFLLLLVWCKQKCDKKVNFFLLFLMCMTFVFLKYKNSSDFFNDVRTCTRSEFFAFEFMNMCDDFQFLVIRMNSTFYSISKLKYRNLNSYFHLLILLSGDISLNPGPTHQHKLQCLNEWNIFKSRGLRFIHLNINSLLPKIEVLRIIAKSTNAMIIGINESKLDESVLEPEIEIDDYKILRCDRNRHGGGVACYIRNDWSYIIISVFPSQIESVFFEILLPNSKPITVGTIYRPPNQSNFLEVQNKNMIKIDSISNETYILGDFNINFSLNDSYVFSKKDMLNNKSIPSDLKSYYEFCTFFSLHQLMEVPTRITCNSATIIDHILASYPERVTQQGIIDVGLSDHQLIFCTIKLSRIKRGTHILNSARSSITRLIFLRKL